MEVFYENNNNKNNFHLVFNIKRKTFQMLYNSYIPNFQKKSSNLDMGNIIRAQPLEIPQLSSMEPIQANKSIDPPFTFNVRVMPEKYFEKLQKNSTPTREKSYLPELKANSKVSTTVSQKIKEIQQPSEICGKKRSLVKQEECDVIQKKVKVEETESLPSTQDGEIDEKDSRFRHYHDLSSTVAPTENDQLTHYQNIQSFYARKKMYYQIPKENNRILDMIRDSQTQRLFFIVETGFLGGKQIKYLTREELMTEDPILLIGLYEKYLQFAQNPALN